MNEKTNGAYIYIYIIKCDIIFNTCEYLSVIYFLSLFLSKILFRFSYQDSLLAFD